jgi:TolA-binding protein
MCSSPLAHRATLHKSPPPMSSPATPAQPTPAPADAHGFDPIEFWYLHKTKVIALGLLLVIGLAGYSIFSMNQRSAREAAARDYAAAKSVEDFRKVIAQHAGSQVAGNAQLRLAALLRKEGKTQDAATELKNFIDKNPQHPLMAGAWLGLAEVAEEAGTLDGALTSYQKILTSFPGSYVTPLALLGQARVQKAKGQNDLAKRSYEEVMSKYQNTPFQLEAMRELGALNKN